MTTTLVLPRLASGTIGKSVEAVSSPPPTFLPPTRPSISVSPLVLLPPAPPLPPLLLLSPFVAVVLSVCFSINAHQLAGSIEMSPQWLRQHVVVAV